MDAFDEADRVRLRLMYDALQYVLQVVRATVGLPAVSRVAALGEIVASEVWCNGLIAARGLGRDLAPASAPWSDHDLQVRRAVHDCRGGAFQALTISLDLVEAGSDPAEAADLVFYLARDHLKMMRNAVRDLDVVAYAFDREHRLHDIALLVEKWSAVDHPLDASTSARIRFRSSYAGPIAERCLEFGALDRVMYNTVNNAVRWASDGVVEVLVCPLAPTHAPTDLRFEISNRVDHGQLERLVTTAEAHPQGLGVLFADGFTIGGSGLGLGICAEFVQNAYGLDSLAKSLEGRYLGARLEGATFRVWFHWPTAATSSEVPYAAPSS